MPSTCRTSFQIIPALVRNRVNVLISASRFCTASRFSRSYTLARSAIFFQSSVRDLGLFSKLHESSPENTDELSHLPVSCVNRLTLVILFFRSTFHGIQKEENPMGALHPSTDLSTNTLHVE